MMNVEEPSDGGIAALLGPTNTGKTHRAVERLLGHDSGVIGLPLRLLAREVYDRVTAKIGERQVALVTGEEKRVPARPRYWVTTVESMPLERDVDFVCVDEIQMAAHPQRGHTFTDRLLHARGRKETWFLGAETMREQVETLVPTASIHRFPRFSALTHIGVKTIGALPARTALVAFSIQDVYALAERVRQRHGGTAVVLGALSPRTRNAQVAMYEAGEVAYMVATDAIGMGLNLDLDRVVFASLSKFDGQEMRPLHEAEIGQIAGRAGRYTRDGGFGTLKPTPELHPRLVHAVENHRFPPVRKLQWRNRDLDFSSVDTLIASLKQRPRQGSLRLTDHAEDYEALVQLARRDDVRRQAKHPERVALLWEVCRIPDFRKLLEGSHVQLLADIFEQLCGPAGVLDVDWMAPRIERLDDTEGGIDALVHRMSFIRTWTYITHRDDWVPDAGHWQAVTRAIEDRHSDALHERLTERFVDGHTHVPQYSRKRSRKPPPKRASPTKPVDPANPFATLAGLDVPGVAEPPGSGAWVEDVVTAEHDAIALDDRGKLQHGDVVLARLKRGTDIRHPEIAIDGALDVGAGAQSRLIRRLVAWCRDAVAGLLEPAEHALAEGLSAAGRGVAYQMQQGLGSVERRDAKQQLRDLVRRDHEVFERHGLVAGRLGAFIRRGCEPAAIKLRLALWGAWFEQALPSFQPGALSFVPEASLPAHCLAYSGYALRAGRAIRLDVLDALDRELSTRMGRGRSGLRLDASLFEPLGCTLDELLAIVRSLGYRRTDRGWMRGR